MLLAVADASRSSSSEAAAEAESTAATAAALKDHLLALCLPPSLPSQWPGVGVIVFTIFEEQLCVYFSFSGCFSVLVLGSCFTQNFVCLAQINLDSAGEM